MIYLVLSLIFSSAIFLIFKLFSRHEVHTFQAIVINYFTAAILGISLIAGDISSGEIIYSPLIKNGALLGFLFIGLFYLMAKTSQEMGAGISSVATKLSLVIPAIFFMFFDRSDSFSMYKIAALIIAIPGIYLTVYSKGAGKFSLILPLILFLGSGVLDIVLAYTDQHYAHTDSDKIVLTCLPFITAGFTGLIILTLSKKRDLKPTKKTIIAGIILGVVNFGSIFYLLKTFDSLSLSKSQIIPVNNLGIVILSSLAAYILLKEKLSRTNKAGLIISGSAIFILLVESYS